MDCTTQYAGADCTPPPPGPLPYTGLELAWVIGVVACLLALGALVRFSDRSQ